MNLSVHAGLGSSSTPHGLEKSIGEDGLTVLLERNKSDVVNDAFKLEQGGKKEEGKAEESMTQAINMKADDEEEGEDEDEVDKGINSARKTCVLSEETLNKLASGIRFCSLSAFFFSLFVAEGQHVFTAAIVKYYRGKPVS